MTTTNNITIRPFQPTTADYAAIFAIHQALHPEEQLTVEMFQKQNQAFAAENQYNRLVAEVEGHAVAYGTSWQSLTETNEPAWFSLFVHPDYQTTEIPRQMHNQLLAGLEASGAAVIVSEPTDDQQYRIQLLEASQFTLKMRFPRSQLDVNAFDTAPYHSLKTQLEAENISFVTLTDVMAHDEQWQRNVWRMFTIIDQDVPYPDPQKSVPFETYATYYTGELFRPGSWAIALDQTRDGAEQYVGMSVVNIMPSRPDTLFAGITGVVPQYRRRKIATMLKALSVRYAEREGYHYIYTDNEEDNPMYTLNLQLGFEPLPAWVYYEKQLS